MFIKLERHGRKNILKISYYIRFDQKRKKKKKSFAIIFKSDYMAFEFGVRWVDHCQPSFINVSYGTGMWSGVVLQSNNAIRMDSTPLRSTKTDDDGHYFNYNLSFGNGDPGIQDVPFDRERKKRKKKISTIIFVGEVTRVLKFSVKQQIISNRWFY